MSRMMCECFFSSQKSWEFRIRVN